VPADRPEIVTADSALSGVDPSRRYGLALGGGAPAFAGLGHDEAERVAAALGGLSQVGAGALLVEVVLPIVLSDGAGPHLLDVDGRLTLAVADHPTIPGARIAVGAASPLQRIGLVRRAEPASAPLWEWLAVREAPESQRVAVLDELDGIADENAAMAWSAPIDARRGGGGRVRPEP